MVHGARRRPETVAEALEQWLEQARASLKASTLATTRVILDAHLLPRMGEVALGELTNESVEGLYCDLVQGGGRGGRALSSATVRRAHNVLHRGLAHAVERGWLLANPASSASLPELPAREPPSISPSVVCRLLSHAEGEDDRLGLFIRLAALTGARRGQLVALRWSDVDWSSGTLWVEDTTRRAVHRPGPSDRRQLSVDTDTLEMLKVHKARAEAAAEACGVGLSEEALVFSDSADSLMTWSPASITQAFARLADGAGVAEVRLDDLRHFAPAQLLSAGADARSVAVRVWGQSPWPRYLYTEPAADFDRKAAEVLARLLSLGRNEPEAAAQR